MIFSISVFPIFSGNARHEAKTHGAFPIDTFPSTEATLSEALLLAAEVPHRTCVNEQPIP